MASRVLRPVDAGGHRVRFNIMTVGQRSMGKSTFLKSMLRDYVSDFDIEKPPAMQKDTRILSPHYSEADTVRVVEVGRAEVNSVDLVMYDGQGYGDFINNQDAVDTIRNHLIKQHASWRNLDIQTMSREDINRSDERIHCVIYFLSAGHIKEIDLRFLSSLSDIVPIIPVVAKADTMNLTERNEFLNEIHNSVEKLSNKMGNTVIYDFNAVERDVGVSKGPGNENQTYISTTLPHHTPEANTPKRCPINRAPPLHEGPSPVEDIGTTLESEDYITYLSHTHAPHTHAPKYQCQPSPGFIALFEDIDSDNSTACSSFGENLNRDSRDSLCSLDTNDGLQDSNPSLTLSDSDDDTPTFGPTSDTNIAPSVKGVTGTQIAPLSVPPLNISRDGLEMKEGLEGLQHPVDHSLDGDDGMKYEDMDLDTYFNQQTFVNVGKALCDSAQEGDLGLSSGDDSGDNTPRGEGSNSLMMDSAVFISVSAGLQGHSDSSPRIVGATPLIANPLFSFDSSRPSRHSPPSHPSKPDAMICKIVTSKVCDLVANPGERAACKIVSKIVCEHMFNDEVDIYEREREARERGECDGEKAEFTGENLEKRIESGQKELLAKAISESLSESSQLNTQGTTQGDAQRKTHGNTQEHTLGDTLICDDTHPLTDRSESTSAGKMQEGVCGKGKGEEGEGEEGEEEQGEEETPTIFMSPVIFTMAEIENQIQDDLMTLEEGEEHSSCPSYSVDMGGVHRYPNIFSIICMDYSKDGRSNRDMAVAQGLSDVDRLQHLLFDGPHMGHLMNLTREKSIKLFSSKSAASYCAMMGAELTSIKGIYRMLSSFLSVPSPSTQRDFSNLFSLLDPVPLPFPSIISTFTWLFEELCTLYLALEYLLFLMLFIIKKITTILFSAIKISEYCVVESYILIYRISLYFFSYFYFIGGKVMKNLNNFSENIWMNYSVFYLDEMRYTADTLAGEHNSTPVSPISSHSNTASSYSAAISTPDSPFPTFPELPHFYENKEDVTDSTRYAKKRLQEHLEKHEKHGDGKNLRNQENYDSQGVSASISQKSRTTDTMTPSPTDIKSLLVTRLASILPAEMGSLMRVPYSASYSASFSYPTSQSSYSTSHPTSHPTTHSSNSTPLASRSTSYPPAHSAVGSHWADTNTADTRERMDIDNLPAATLTFLSPTPVPAPLHPNYPRALHSTGTSMGTLTGPSLHGDTPRWEGAKEGGKEGKESKEGGKEKRRRVIEVSPRSYIGVGGGGAGGLGVRECMEPTTDIKNQILMERKEKREKGNNGEKRGEKTEKKKEKYTDKGKKKEKKTIGGHAKFPYNNNSKGKEIILQWVAQIVWLLFLGCLFYMPTFFSPFLVSQRSIRPMPSTPPVGPINPSGTASPMFRWLYAVKGLRPLNIPTASASTTANTPTTGTVSTTSTTSATNTPNGASPTAATAPYVTPATTTPAINPATAAAAVCRSAPALGKILFTQPPKPSLAPYLKGLHEGDVRDVRSLPTDDMGEKGEKKNYLQPYPAPRNTDKLPPVPVQFTSEIDASSEGLLYCLKYHEDGVFECLSDQLCHGGDVMRKGRSKKNLFGGSGAKGVSGVGGVDEKEEWRERKEAGDGDEDEGDSLKEMISYTDSSPLSLEFYFTDLQNQMVIYEKIKENTMKRKNENQTFAGTISKSIKYFQLLFAKYLNIIEEFMVCFMSDAQKVGESFLKLLAKEFL